MGIIEQTIKTHKEIEAKCYSCDESSDSNNGTLLCTHYDVDRDMVRNRQGNDFSCRHKTDSQPN